MQKKMLRPKNYKNEADKKTAFTKQNLHSM